LASFESDAHIDECVLEAATVCMTQFETDAGVDEALHELCGVSSSLVAIKAIANNYAHRFRNERQKQQVKH
jgi:hypothetical protein